MEQSEQVDWSRLDLPPWFKPGDTGIAVWGIGSLEEKHGEIPYHILMADTTEFPVEENTGECEYCYGTGAAPGAPTYRCRVFPPAPAQAIHELLQEDFPEHDPVECFCCCLDCPGWTMDMGILSEEEIRDIIPLHDFHGSRPLPVKGHLVSGGTPAGAPDAPD